MTIQRLVAVVIAIIGVLSISVPAEQYYWYYSALDTKCHNTQCGLGYTTRTAVCADSTNTQVDDKFCIDARGPAVVELECFYNKPDGTFCGSEEYPGLAYDCIYNPQHAKSDPDSLYQICQCKNGFTGSNCEVVPPNPPVPVAPVEPEPEIEPEPEGKGTDYKLIFTIIAIVGFLLAVIILLIYLKRRNNAAKELRQKQQQQPNELFPDQTGNYAELDNISP